MKLNKFICVQQQYVAHGHKTISGILIDIADIKYTGFEVIKDTIFYYVYLEHKKIELTEKSHGDLVERLADTCRDVRLADYKRAGATG